MKIINVYIADDHVIVQDGLKSILGSIPEFNIVGSAVNGLDCLSDIRGGLKVDVILMDIDMPKLSGIETTSFLKKEFPQIRILGLSMHNEQSVIQKLIDAGADGYILKNSDGNELTQGISTVLEGKKYFSTEVTMTLLGQSEEILTTSQSSSELADLTEREIEILKLIAEGFSNKEVGDKLFISHRTVDTHRTNLMRKLDVHNIAGLIKIALKNGLAD
ncbi:MAG: response regulator [Salibacteraceae bacterium]